MRKRARIRILLISLLTVLILPILSPVTALAQEPQVTLETRFPIITGDSSTSFSFDVTLRYTGPERQRFSIAVTPPSDWTASATVSFQRAAVVEIGPAEDFPVTETISVSMAPVTGRRPDPGDYVTRLEISSNTLTETLDLTARVTARYGMSMVTDSGRLNTEVEAGKDSHLALSLINTGTAPLDNVTFSSSKPDGWTVTFNPDRVDSLATGFTQQVDVVINAPSGRSIAGDYAMTISAQSANSSSSVDMRVTVKTPSIWGFISIAIVLVVVAGLVVLFKVLGRR